MYLEILNNFRFLIFLEIFLLYFYKKQVDLFFTNSKISNFFDELQIQI